MARGKLIEDLISKKIYEGESDDQLIQVFTDYAITGGKNGKNRIRGKAIMNNAISCHLFEYLESYHVMTHFLSKLSEKEMVIKKSERLPFYVTVTNLASGKLAKRIGFENGLSLENPIIEFFLEDEDLKYPMVNESHLLALNILTKDEILSVNRILQKVNAVLKSFFERREMYFAQITLRFCRYKGHMLIGDEMTPDTYHLLDTETNEHLDLIRFSGKHNNMANLYKKVHDKILGD